MRTQFSGFLLIKRIETITKGIEIYKARLGISIKMTKAKNMAKIGFKNANENALETSMRLIPSNKR